MTTSRETIEREFERNGEERIRRELWEGNLTGEFAVHASKWLDARSEARELKSAASNRLLLYVTLAGVIVTAIGIVVGAVVGLS